MYSRALILLTGGVIALSSASTDLFAAEPSTLEFGLRGTAELANGKPANDILGYGIYGRYPINKKWGIGLGVDLADYDLENPSKLLGLSSVDPKIIDAKTSSTMVSVVGERYFDDVFDSSLLYVNVGLGINNIDVKNATGDLEGGGTYDIKTDVGSDAVLIAGFGIQKPLGKNWVLDSNLGLRNHFGKWSMEDVNSGKKGTVDGFFSWAFQLGVTRKF